MKPLIGDSSVTKDIQDVKRTWQDVLTPSADLLHVIMWYVDASFAVHPNFKSHTGSVMTMVEGAIQGNFGKKYIYAHNAKHRLSNCALKYNKEVFRLS